MVEDRITCLPKEASRALAGAPERICFPDYERREIVADGVVHALGIALALVAVPWLVWAALPGRRIAALVYGVALLSMLIASASYNMSRPSILKARLRQFDYSGIFLKIAGSYTPLALHFIGGIHGLVLFAGVWLLAVLGVVFKFTAPARVERGSLFIFLALGWVILFCARALVSADIGGHVIWLIGAGGLSYSAGVIFHRWHALRFQNAIWHLFVVLGSGFIFLANALIVTGRA